MVFYIHKTLILIFLTSLIFCAFDVTGLSIFGVEERNQTELELSEAVQNGMNEKPNDDANAGDCEPNPCQNGGACILTDIAFLCECENQYTGKFCEKNICDGKCLNNGTCRVKSGGEAECECPDDYTGKICEYPSKEKCSRDSPKCEETGGVCISKKKIGLSCECPKATYYDIKYGCTVMKEKCTSDFPKCEETGGACISNKTKGIICECPEGLHYEDPYGCVGEIIDCPENMTNCEKTGGYCESVNSEIRCICSDNENLHMKNLSYYVNDFGCRISSLDCMLHLKYCAKSGGICTFSQSGMMLVCQCPEDPIGQYHIWTECQVSSRCNESMPGCLQTGGSCSFDENAEIRCECPDGTVYQQGCQVMEETCSMDHPKCEETGGKCISNENGTILCECPKDAAGYYISHGCTSVPEVPCSRNMTNCKETGGFCTSINDEMNCECPPVFEYENDFGCHVPLNTCDKLMPKCLQTGGTCALEEYGEISCKCPERMSYRRQGCQESCTEDSSCFNGGRCIYTGDGFDCACEEPYTGKFCEKNLCSENPCLNGGHCKITGKSFKCFCEKPFAGKYCEMDDACGSYPCLNGGQCYATGGDSFECVCDHYYSGKFCEIKLPDTISSFKSFPVVIVVLLCIGSFILGFVLMLCCWLCLRRK